MPDPQNTGTTPPAQTPPPESTLETIKRNVTPEIDFSRAALGPGHEFDAAASSPQQEGEQQYKEMFGSPLERAYGHAKKFLETHEQHLSEKYLAPFREGLDRMAEDLQTAGETGHTKTGGQLNPVTRLLAGGVGQALKFVPVGRDVKETALMSLTPPELGPEGKALSRELRAGQRVAEKAAPNLEGLRVREVSPSPQKSAFRIAAENPEKHAEFQEAVKNTEGAELHDKGLTLDVVRHQKPEQAGERAVRTGVFFLPEKKSPYQRYYTTGRIGYGGSQRIEGRTTFENPIIAKGASGGKVPERAYDAINGQGAYDEMRQDVLDATVHGFAYGPKDAKVLTQRVADVLEKYGGNPELAPEIVRTSKEGNTLPYAVQEHIVASSVRNAGHDSVIGYSKIKGQHRLSEVFDVRRDKYPISSQLFESSPTAGKSKVVSPAKEVPKPTQHEAVGVHSDDLPYRAKYQDVDFSAQDLQDSAKKVTPDTIRKDYAGGEDGLLEYDRTKKGWRSQQPSIYQAYIPIEDLPSPKFVEEREENFDRSDYSRPRVGVPIKVEVLRDGKLSILDGNHRAKVWEEQGHEYAPAWVVDRRGPNIENISEAEKAEREAEEEERQAAQQRKPPAPDLTGLRVREVSPVSEVTAGSAQSELPTSMEVTAESKAKERAANLKGLGIGLTEMDPADAKNWVGFTGQKTLKVYRGVADPNHTIEAGDFVTTSKESAQNYGKHVQEIEVSPSELRYVRGHKDGDPKLLDQGGQTELIYAPKKPNKASPQTEQPSVYTLEGAQPLAEKLGAKVVGSVATRKTTADPYGINRGPKDLDLRIDGKYKPDEVESKLKAEGFEPSGSSVVSPKEQKSSDKDYGKPGWKRAEHFENAAGQKIDVWHDEPEASADPAKVELKKPLHERLFDEALRGDKKRGLKNHPAKVRPE